MSVNNLDSHQNQIVKIERLRKPRRKHKNSKFGCVQCKERRMKCDEELPQCKNCKIRQIKIPCSYLSFTKEEKEKFLEEKKKQRLSLNSPSPSSSGSSNSTSNSPNKSNHDIAKFNLIRHARPFILKSQLIGFFGEPESSVQGRIFYTSLIGKSFLNLHEAFNTQLCLASYWLYMQMKRKYETIEDYGTLINEDDLRFLHDFTYQQKAKSLRHLRRIVLKVMEAQEQKDHKKALMLYSDITMPTICLESLDLLSKGSLKSYYIEGSIQVLKELYSSTSDSSPISKFVLESLEHIVSALFVPSYKLDVLLEVYEVIKDFETAVKDANDDLLSLHYEELVDYLSKYIIDSSVRYRMNKDYITDYPPGLLYELYFKFNSILPSEAFTIILMKSPVHKVFYSFYYMIGRVLDNVFPETRYLSQHRFIGPTTMYPYTKQDIYDGLSEDLIFFANYSLRLTSFFTRRIDFFVKYMKILNPFPKKLPENRFQSRKTNKINEIQITSFKNTIIRQWHYPQVEKKRSFDGSATESPSSTGSFSTNFSALISMDNITDDFTTFDFDEHQTDRSVNFHDIADSGLLTQDYDPLLREWKDAAKNIPYKPAISLMSNLVDRSILMNEFSRNSS